MIQYARKAGNEIETSACMPHARVDGYEYHVACVQVVMSDSAGIDRLSAHCCIIADLPPTRSSCGRCVDPIANTARSFCVVS